MNLVSIRIITRDVARLVDFYERATGVRADRPTEDFAELRTPSGTLAIGSTRTVDLFAPGSAREDFVNEPTTMPWGNRSLLFRDPDGNLVNFFSRGSR